MLWYGNWIILHLNVRLLEGGWPNMCVANKCHHLSGLAWQFLVPGHYQNWWLHWLLIIKMSVSQIHDIWMIYFVSQWVGGWEIRFPKSHGSYPDNVCKLQLYGTCMYVIIGCQYLSGLDCHFFFLTLTPQVENSWMHLLLCHCWCPGVKQQYITSNNASFVTAIWTLLLKKKSISFHTIKVLWEISKFDNIQLIKGW